MRTIIFASMIALGVTAAGADTITAPVRNGDAEHGNTLSNAVQLWGIDMPESQQLCRNKFGKCYPCGEAAISVLHNLLVDRAAKCKLAPGQTEHGGAVATCTVDGVDLGLHMLREGMAVASKSFLDSIPEKKPDYLDAQQEAKSAERGIWQGEFILPSEWRNENRRLPGCE